MKAIITCTLLLFHQVLWSQWQYDFSEDWEKIRSEWSGDLSNWTTESGFLRSNGPAVSGTCIALQRDIQVGNSFELAMALNLKLATSSNNYFVVELKDTVGTASLELLLGGTKDAISAVYSKDAYSLALGSSQEKILASSSSNPVALRLRKSDGQWRLEFRVGEAKQPWSELFQDSLSEASFHLLELKACYSASNAHKFWVDHIYTGEPRFDRTAPRLLSSYAIGNQEVELLFSEPMDTTKGISSAGSMAWGSSVLLRVTLPILDSVELKLEAFQDEAGNLLGDTLCWVYPEARKYRSIRITEFMADPTPSQGLPEWEYVEWFNAGDQDQNTKDWQFFDGQKWFSLPPLEFPSKSYFLLTSKGGCLELAAFGPCVELEMGNGFLSNAADVLALMNRSGDTLEFISYDADWPHDKEGGRALERFGELRQCLSDGEGFLPGIHPSGGTPGRKNSLADYDPDSIPPFIERAYIQGNQELVVLCSESVWGQGALIWDGQVFPALAKGRELRHEFSEPLPQNAENSYAFMLKGFTDCMGNEMLDSIYLIRNAEVVWPEFGDLQLTEIFWETLKEQVPFIEIVNRSRKAISLSGIELLIDEYKFTLKDRVLYPGEVLVLVGKGAEHYARWNPMELAGSFKFGVQGKIKLQHPVQGYLDELPYRKGWYGGEYLPGSGFSMERTDTSRTCGSPNLWRKSEAAEGSPGELKTQATADLGPSNSVVGASWVNENEVRMYFDSPVWEQPVDFFVQGCGMATRIAFSKINPHNVLVYWPKPLPQHLFEIEIHGGQGCNGEPLSKQAVNCGPPGRQESLRINELLYDPLAGEPDFVELRNQSNLPIPLAGLWLGSCDAGGFPDEVQPIGVTDFTVLPGETVCITEAHHLLDLRYHLAEERTLIVPSLPSYSVSGSCVVLLDSALQIIDSFHYYPKMHAPYLIETKGVSLERIDPHDRGPQNQNWTSATANVQYATPGRENSQYRPGSEQFKGDFQLLSSSFSPDGDGFEDHLVLEFQNVQTQGRISLSVHSLDGQPLHVWENLLPIGAEGVLRWNGQRNTGQWLEPGAYVLKMEWLESNGKTHTKRWIIHCASF
ncbi:MAG: lamin tail domain-containing protein [Bacteroidota bacterium]|nr:lamin tail domain-containing protein [Bacteroidota bacterium]MDX5430615.1 lamin tail domain-containing protein [Bacteroidota bacterium]MDX5469367.1 lamin tail domain-containing protein [Bacteroidota bacterium]